MIFNQVVRIAKEQLLLLVAKLYELDGYSFELIEPHVGGRNVIFVCNNAESTPKILRISYLDDRTREDILAEVEYVRFLYDNGASVSNVINSINGNLLEELSYNNQKFHICLFEKAEGKMLVENNYCYREGIPISEYFYNCGKVLGKMHSLSKKYVPIHRRKSFFDKFNMQYINSLIPNSLSSLKEKMEMLIKKLEEIDTTNDTYGMIHFDYSDGNYNIDFECGKITVYDFDNSCFGHYIYDLANIWVQGVGWIQFERDVDKRREFMDTYFSTVIQGYKSEVTIDESMLELLQLFIQATIMETIVDKFEIAKNNGEEVELDDEEFIYLVKCIVYDIPYIGFFDDIYSCDTPFECEK